MEGLLAGLAILAIVVGLAGVVVPLLPGLLLVWAGTAGLVLLSGGGIGAWAVLAFLTVLLALGTAATIVLPAHRGRQGGVPTRSLVAGGVGAVVGFFVVPVVGLLLGAGGGVLLAERARLGDWGPALRSLREVAVGYGVGVLVELAVATVMIATAVVTVLVR